MDNFKEYLHEKILVPEIIVGFSVFIFFVTVFAQPIYAVFLRQTGMSGWGYGYGYGYGVGYGKDLGASFGYRTSGSLALNIHGYGYGYGFRGQDTTSTFQGRDFQVNPAATFSQAVPSLFTFSGDSITAVTQVVASDNIAIVASNDHGNIQSFIPSGVTVTNRSGSAFDITKLTSADKSSVVTASSLGSNVNLRAAVEFGIEGETLSFSSPVTVTIPVDSSLNGQTLSARRSSDGGTTWTSEGLTNASTDTCTDGVGSNPVTSALVSDGTMTVYTCRASYFSGYSSGSSSGNNNSPGGGGSAPVISETAPQVPLFNSQLQLEINKEYSFPLANAPYVITALSASETEAVVIIAGQSYSFIREQAKLLDLNKDGRNDVKITFKSVSGQRVSLQVENLSDLSELKNSVTINSGAYETTNRTVELFMSAKDAETMVVSESADFSDSYFIKYTPAITWNLSKNSGTKTVYVKFRSKDGTTVTGSDSIILVDAASCALTPRSIYNVKGKKEVWFITDRCTKQMFHNFNIFLSYSTVAETLNTTDALIARVPVDALNFIAWGPKHNPATGSLVKTTDNPKVYLITGNTKQWITSEKAFTESKFSWSKVYDVVPEVLDHKEAGADITSPK